MTDNNTESTFWEFSSGLALDDADVEIVEAKFGYDPAGKYMDGNVAVMIFTMKVDGGDGEEVIQLLSIGGGPNDTGTWEPVNGGESVEHSTGKDRFNKSTKYARWISAAIDLPGVMAMLQERGNPNQASIWNGTRWHVVTVQEEMRNLKGPDGKPRVNQVLVPTAYLGEAKANGAKGGAKAGVKAGTKKVVTTGKAAAKTYAWSGFEEDLVAALVDAAKSSADHDTFVTAVHADEFPFMVDEFENLLLDESDAGMYQVMKAGA